MENRIEERLPQVVEDRLQATYKMIREGKGTQMKRKKGKRFGYRKWTGEAEACAVLAAGSLGVMATAAYFQKEMHQEAGEAVYEFELNYELVPGEYKVTPSYLPEGFKDQGAGKYYGEDGLGITIMPIVTMAELDKLDGDCTGRRNREGGAYDFERYGSGHHHLSGSREISEKYECISV